jgi:hypothetical protein
MATMRWLARELRGVELAAGLLAGVVGLIGLAHAVTAPTRAVGVARDHPLR